MHCTAWNNADRQQLKKQVSVDPCTARLVVVQYLTPAHTNTQFAARSSLHNIVRHSHTWQDSLSFTLSALSFKLDPKTIVHRLSLFFVVRVCRWLDDTHGDIASEPTAFVRTYTGTQRNKTVNPTCFLQTAYSTPVLTSKVKSCEYSYSQRKYVCVITLYCTSRLFCADHGTGLVKWVQR